MKRSLLLMSLLASVAACSSGGGSSSPSSGAAVTGSSSTTTSTTTTTTEATPYVFPTAAGSVVQSAATVGTAYGDCYTANAAVCAAGANPTANVAQGSGPSTVTLVTDASGENTLQLNIVDGGGGISHTFDLGSNASPNSNATATDTGLNFIPDGTADGEGNTFSLVYGGSAAGDAENGGLSYLTFGLWNAGANGNGAYGAFNAGSLTPGADMTALAAGAKSADFSGSMIGQANLNGYTYSVTGSPTMHVNFGGATPGWSGSVAANIDTGAWTNVTYNGTLSGGQLVGSVNAAASTIVSGKTGLTENVDAMSGAMNGACYGPSCANIGTVFNMTSAGGNTALGAMGLHQ